MKSSDLFMAWLIVFAIAGATAGIHFAAPKRAVLFSVEPPGVAGRIAFDSFGPGHAFDTNSWAVGGQAHADWFIPAMSGRLGAIELALEATARNAGDATVFLASDKHGFPGATLESFEVAPRLGSAASNPAPVELASLAQPALAAGAKYWLCVRGRGGWDWHFNNQNIVQYAGRETKPGRWATAGDYCYACAFRVLIATNREPQPLAP
ncbi:MAG: choice-of-anchor R domain-containing protein [Verrucomicrobiota bacterium]